MEKIAKDKQEDIPTIMFMCSRHGMQDFKSFGKGSIQLKCGCAWHHLRGMGLQYGKFPGYYAPIKNRKGE